MKYLLLLCCFVLLWPHTIVGQAKGMDKVMAKLRQDSVSYEMFLNLGTIYSLEKAGQCNDCYFYAKNGYYNSFWPLVRLLKDSSLTHVFEHNFKKYLALQPVDTSAGTMQRISKGEEYHFYNYTQASRIYCFYRRSAVTYKSYLTLITKPAAYSTDADMNDEGGQQHYFNDYLRNYFIVIPID